MDNSIIEKWQEYNRNALAAAKELEGINTGVIEKLTGQQMDFANAALETGSRYFSALTEAKGYPELLAEQTRIGHEFNEKLIAAARSTADIFASTREAYQSWMEKSFSVFTANVDFAVPGFPAAAEKKVDEAA